MDNKIDFHIEEIDFQLDNKSEINKWIERIAEFYEVEINSINYIFCSDNYLLDINKEYLNHDYLTDIITFDNRESDNEEIESDIFISIDRVKDNASSLGLSFQEELRRVVIHGFLHLVGFKDKTQEESDNMRLAEDNALNEYNKMFHVEQ
ncbi:rRNA maturation RNase YbeY [Marinigracilibium pacificum]|uniref:Endoribonuclease YbeY n=1 Tax=Marinigracilibium pacificum TaxID=2729599 RepID=A0A848IUY2_9BACT|nr:rRNA maturation RNase YbeY [Marinigracilibium pacificum]NMM46998.1 rRNA maturation RNase YbeY [Marinigracilibium pacificum]